MADVLPIKTWGSEDLYGEDLTAEFANVYSNHVSKSTAQTVSGRKTFTGGAIFDEILSVAAAGSGFVKLFDLRWDPASGTLADNDGMYYDWTADDDGGTETIYARDGVDLTDVTDATEDGVRYWSVMAGGSLARELNLSGAALYPQTNDGLSLGISGTAFSDLFLASGGAVNFDAGDVTLTHAANKLTLDGGNLEFADNIAVALGTGSDATLEYNGTNTVFDLRAVGTGNLLLNNGLVIIGDGTTTSSTDATIGMVVDQRANDDAAIVLQSSDVAHGMTDVAETDSWMSILKRNAGSGGARFTGLSEAAIAVDIIGDATGEDTGKTTGSFGAVRIIATKKSGTGTTSLGADGNLLSIQDSGTTRYLFDVEGSAHADVEWTTYDTYDDLTLIRDMETELLLREDEGMTQRRHFLEATGIIGQGSWHMEDGKPRAMVNFTKLSMLHHGALIQVGERFKELESRNAALEARLKLLEN